MRVVTLKDVFMISSILNFLQRLILNANDVNIVMSLPIVYPEFLDRGIAL